MKPGWRTSEFWMTLGWSVLAATAVYSLLECPPALWPTALIALPAVCVLAWLAGISAHNYSENRFQLKAQRRALLGKTPSTEGSGAEQGAAENSSDPGRDFIFGRHVDSDSSESGEEEVVEIEDS